MISLNDEITIGNLNIKGRTFLAPLAGISDSPFRCMCKQYGAPFSYTEMVSAKALTYNNKNTFDLLKFKETEKPIAVQLFGSQIHAFEEATRILEDYNFEIIDINMGCPVSKIVKNGEGAALMNNVELAIKIVKAVKFNTKKVISVKFRRGYDYDKDNSLEFGKALEQAGADMITIHGRYRTQMYSGSSNLDCIKKVKEKVKIPVFASGDIFSKEDAISAIKKTNCDGVMIARGSLGRPWIFKELLDLDNQAYIPTIAERCSVIKEHARLCVEEFGESVGIKKMRTHLAYYTKGLKNSAKLRSKLSVVSSFSDILNYLDELKEIVV